MTPSRRAAETALASLHRAYMIAVLPFVWASATVAYAVCAPISAGEVVWNSFKKHWKAQ